MSTAARLLVAVPRTFLNTSVLNRSRSSHPPTPGPASSLGGETQLGGEAQHGDDDAEPSPPAPEQETPATETTGETETIQRVSISDRAVSEPPHAPDPAHAPAPEPSPPGPRPAVGAQEGQNREGKTTGQRTAAPDLPLALAA